MRATFYARVSSDTEEQKNSIKSQVGFFQDYMKTHHYTPADSGVFFKRDGSAEVTNGYYVDEGFSGAKSAKYRKAFQQMIRDAKARKFDIIFTKNISRFGRNVQEILKYIGDLRELGIGVYFEDVNINTLDRTDDVKITIFAALAEEESRAKSDSVQFGKLRGYKNGIWGGREPYGYNIKEGKLQINEAEAIVVKEVFDLYLNECMGLRNIAKHLNNKGVPTKSGNTIFDQSLISKMLVNVIYKGEIRLHRTQKVDINRNLIRKIPEHEQVVLQDEGLRIIDDETFKLVQLEKEKRFKKFGDFKYINIVETNDQDEDVTKKVRTIDRGLSRHSNKHIFSNLLKCGNCGGSLRRKVQKNKNRTFIYWFCRNNDNFGKTKCKFRNLQHEDKLLEYVKEEIITYQNNPDKGYYYLQTLIKQKYDLQDINDRVSIAREIIKEIKQDKEANFTLYARKIINEDEFSERNDRLSQKLYDNETQLNQLIYIEDEIRNIKLRYTHYRKAFEEMDIDNLTNANLRKFIHSIIATTNEEPATIGFRPHTLKINWSFLDTTESEINQENQRITKEIWDNSLFSEEEFYNLNEDEIVRLSESFIQDNN